MLSQVGARAVVPLIVSRVVERISQDECAIHVLSGAAGEGRSTALRQIVARLAMDHAMIVLWRKDALATITPVQVEHAVDQREVLLGRRIPVEPLVQLASDLGGIGETITLDQAEDPEWLARLTAKLVLHDPTLLQPV